MSNRKITSCHGFTLVESVVVVAILAVVATLGVTKMLQSVDSAKRTAAESDLKHLREAFLDPEAGYLRDMRGIPGFSVGYLRIANLFISTNLYGAVEDGAVRTTGVRVDIEDKGPLSGEPCAKPSAFTQWDPEAERGWRGPYLMHFSGDFPQRTSRRFEGDASADKRGFFPELFGLREPSDFLDRKDGCSIYGFPGEPALIDPWGNPYVLQIPPPQAFPGVTNIPDEVRFRFARVVSAGPDGRLATPCFGVNMTNWWATAWTERTRRLSRQAGRIDGDNISARGDDLVLFFNREDVDEGEDE